eukprot:CAMPEP_0205929424 /NCGR_PEP_ID=MMETSP1325-20131115/25299_1 /ASSEMBLY_ACC=CAM_ASM_000708 /TAXON_ID=236786 /ORGANISM="Florenciella sp., Strain RCC1007" /LENGTH=99 /DNA_ID=CAMNT_0053298637 /DNA_START=383 /DNA_END=683 /DNA_ORIENTATION=-
MHEKPPVIRGLSVHTSRISLWRPLKWNQPWTGVKFRLYDPGRKLGWLDDEPEKLAVSDTARVYWTWSARAEGTSSSNDMMTSRSGWRHISFTGLPFTSA